MVNQSFISLVVAVLIVVSSHEVFSQRSYPVCRTRSVTAVGTDGRQWGFENGESCIMPGSVNLGDGIPVADTNGRLGGDASSLPLCGGDTVTGRGRNGELYGHENGNTCLIRL